MKKGKKHSTKNMPAKDNMPPHLDTLETAQINAAAPHPMALLWEYVCHFLPFIH
jgi:hypothetical protein